MTRFDLMKFSSLSIQLPRHFIWVFCSLCFMLLLAGCHPEDETKNLRSSVIADDGVVDIYVVNEPLRYMAERLVDPEWANVVFPAPEDVADPAFWEPDEDQITAYQQADLIILNGADYAGWVQTSSLPASRMVNTSLGFKDLWIMDEAGPTHQHGPEGEHSHAGLAFTTWLDFGLAQRQAEAIFEALRQRWPDHEGSLNRKWSALTADLQAMDAAMKSLRQEFGEAPVLGSHPVYQYLARAYDLRLHSLHWEPDVTPDEEAWQDLDDYLAETPTQWMLWEDTPNSAIQQHLEKRRIQWTVFRPQGGKTAEGDFLSVMKTNIQSWQQKLD